MNVSMRAISNTVVLYFVNIHGVANASEGISFKW